MVLKYLTSAFSGALNRNSVKTNHASANLRPLPGQPAGYEIPPSCLLTPMPHPLTEQVTQEINKYYLDHWPFHNDKTRKKFAEGGCSLMPCFIFPKARDDRIRIAVRLMTVLFLMDDELDYLSVEDGKAYYCKLFPNMRGEVLPDRSVPAQYILYDLFEDMRAQDLESAKEIMEETFVFMRAQTDYVRMKPMGLREYFDYRERDGGMMFTSALMCYCTALGISSAEIQISRADMTYSKHIMAVNDIWSYEKEVVVAEKGHKEGGILVNYVAILAEEAGLSIPAAKRLLYGIVREWELHFRDASAQVLARCNTPTMRAYLEGLEYIMGGNEMWSRTVKRYVVSPSSEK